jgi:hypothetical protein
MSSHVSELAEMGVSVDAYEALSRGSELIDALYKANDRPAVEAAVAFLSDAAGLDDVLANEGWREVASHVEAEMERLRIVEPEPVGSFLVYRVSTPMNLISALTRHFAHTRDERVLVVNDGYDPRADQVYVRNVDGAGVARALDVATERGLSAGGKSSVFAAIVPKDVSVEFAEELVRVMDA